MFDKKAFMSEYNKKYFASHRAYYLRWRRKFTKENPEYGSWMKVRSRCLNKKSHNYKWYGGRGIKVLYKSYAEFRQDVGPKPDSSFSIDRINNNRHYEPGNCRWATYIEQAANRRKPRSIKCAPCT